MSTDREQILGRVNRALAPLPRRAALPDWEREVVVMRQARGDVDKVSLFAERLRAVNGTPLTAVTELIALLEKNNWRRGYCDPQLWAQFGRAFPATIKVETTLIARGLMIMNLASRRPPPPSPRPARWC